MTQTLLFVVLLSLVALLLAQSDKEIASKISKILDMEPDDSLKPLRLNAKYLDKILGYLRKHPDKYDADDVKKIKLMIKREKKRLAGDNDD